MKVTIWVFLVLFVYITAAADEKKIVCYFGSWAVYRYGNGQISINEIDPTLCTHLIYTFIGITQTAKIDIIDPWGHLPSGKDGFNLFTKLREKSPSTKTLIAVGGWNEGSQKYSKVVANPKLRKILVDNLVNFVKKWNFDGLDFDWEYPNQRGGVEADKKNYVLLLKELRKRFDQEGLLLSAAVAGAKTSAGQSYIISEVSKYLDFINIMAYDLHGAWDKKTGINAPLYAGSWEKESEQLLNVNACINYWLSEGAPREKLILGIPTYGRSFTLDDPQNNGIGASASSPGQAGPYTNLEGTLGYNEFCEKQLKDKWEIHFQEEQRVPYAVKGNQWIGYDDVRSIKEKAEYINSLNLGGAMIWSIETDDFKGICGEKYPLLKTLNNILRNNTYSTTPTPSQPSSLPSSSIKPSTQSSPSVESSTSPEASSTKPPLTTESPFECKAPGYARDLYDCAVFYMCIFDGKGGFIKYANRCADGLYFDEKILTCNYSHLVDCNV